MKALQNVLSWVVWFLVALGAIALADDLLKKIKNKTVVRFRQSIHSGIIWVLKLLFSGFKLILGVGMLVGLPIAIVGSSFAREIILIILIFSAIFYFEWVLSEMTKKIEEVGEKVSRMESLTKDILHSLTSIELALGCGQFSKRGNFEE